MKFGLLPCIRGDLPPKLTIMNLQNDPVRHHTVYITTAIDYVNAAPHIGHAYEKIAADVLTRFYRLNQRSVFFLTGSDEHGTKVAKTASEKGMTPKAYADELSQQFKTAWKQLDIAYDRYIRTTDYDHSLVVAEIWRRMLAKGDLYKASYEGLYCAGCETFLNERDLDGQGFCRLHPNLAIERVAEENWFFRLSAYRDKLKAHFEANPGFIQPVTRQAEVFNWLEDLCDISVSRSRRSVSWGLPVPDDPDQVIYVWIDALSNYLSGAKFIIPSCSETASESDSQVPSSEFYKIWPATWHIIGKDILRFHALYWPAMLMSAEIPLPEALFAHGFITVNAEKISKSTGNVVAPKDLLDRFDLPNPDPLRYYLMAATPFGQDGNFGEEEFKLKINADLANNFGNLLNRTVSMLVKYFGGQIPVDIDELIPLGKPDWLQAVHEAYQRLAFHEVCDGVIAHIDAANKLINDQAPWALFKAADADSLYQLKRVMVTVAHALAQSAVALSAITPNLSLGVWQQLGLHHRLPFEQISWQDLTRLATMFSSSDATALKVQPGGPLLPRLDSELVGASVKKG
ncbi:MAG: methionine--tRNA ligase [Vampirovibrionales bacterium]|nr:methionine--tRNA ligase [Vampirovibrionales bacterium]